MSLAMGLPPSSDLDSRVDALWALLAGRRFVALTGAGCSTDSGIPDYRGQGRTGPRNPIQHDAFLRRAEVRRRYWARSTLGWARFSAAAPNPAHHALASMEAAGPLAGVITQNVDRLHHRAGSRRVVELHGALDQVFCLRCGHREARADLQLRLLDANPDWLARARRERRGGNAGVRPDGDVELDADAVARFRVVDCLACDGELKPDVVFFGGSVAAPTVAAAFDLLDVAGALLVAGSSLAVYSGFRFVRRARERGLPIAVVNLGPTRADEIADVKIESSLSTVLPRLADRLHTS